MLYSGYQIWTDAVAPFRAAASRTLGLRESLGEVATWSGPRRAFALMSLLADTKVTHHRPSFGIDSVPVGNQDVAVREEIVASLPFGDLLHFAKDDIETPQ